MAARVLNSLHSFFFILQNYFHPLAHTQVWFQGQASLVSTFLKDWSQTTENLKIRVSESHCISLQLGALVKGNKSCTGTFIRVECSVSVTEGTALLGEANSLTNI